MSNSKETIPAKAYSDDRNVEVAFDATEWFEQAKDGEILDLAKCGFGGDYPADRVAEFFEERNPDVRGLFCYLGAIRNDRSRKDCCGFECRVDEGAAMEWLRQNRPLAYGRALAIRNG